jgi:putative ABC transport system permease protein
LGTRLAEKLGVGVGDMVTVKVLEGARPRLDLPVAAVHQTLIGMPAYMDLAALNLELGVPPAFAQANLLIDQNREAALPLHPDPRAGQWQGAAGAARERGRGRGG